MMATWLMLLQTALGQTVLSDDAFIYNVHCGVCHGTLDPTVVLPPDPIFEADARTIKRALKGKVGSMPKVGVSKEERERLISFLAAARARYTKERAATAKQMLKVAEMTGEEDPSALLEKAKLVDGWGEPLVVLSVDPIFRVISYGADKAPGGDGEDADITFPELFFHGRDPWALVNPPE